MAVEVDGLRQTVRQLQDLGVEIDDLKDAFAEIASEAASVIRAAAPKGQTGALKASVRGNRAKGKAVVTAGSARRVPYAPVINYGWPKRHIKARYFMQEADQHNDRWVQMLEEGIARLLKEFQ